MDMERLQADEAYQIANKRAWADGERYDKAIADAVERLTCAQLFERLPVRGGFDHTPDGVVAAVQLKIADLRRRAEAAEGAVCQVREEMRLRAEAAEERALELEKDLAVQRKRAEDAEAKLERVPGCAAVGSQDGYRRALDDVRDVFNLACASTLAAVTDAIDERDEVAQREISALCSANRQLEGERVAANKRAEDAEEELERMRGSAEPVCYVTRSKQNGMVGACTYRSPSHLKQRCVPDVEQTHDTVPLYAHPPAVPAQPAERKLERPIQVGDRVIHTEDRICGEVVLVENESTVWFVADDRMACCAQSSLERIED